VTWVGAHGDAQVRFRRGGSWSPWEAMGEDGVEEPGRLGAALVPAHHADAYQLRVPGGTRNARTVAINTTDGPRTTTAAAPAATSATATATSSPVYVSRSQWGADESLRFDAAGNEIWPAEYFPAQKLTVHHTATTNGDPDPAATVRAIYRYHAIDRGWGDIGYQFLVDTDRRPTAGAQRGLEQLLAALAARTGIGPTGSGTYTNPSRITYALLPHHLAARRRSDGRHAVPGAAYGYRVVSVDVAGNPRMSATGYVTVP
jgi:hypothetical protein